MSSPFVSIIIPAKNAQATIRKCVDSVLNQKYNNYELIVIDDGSSDETADILRNCQGIKILATKGVGPAKARNIALEQAAGEFIAFTDADCIVDDRWPEELLKGFTAPDVAGVGGIQKSPDDDSQFGKTVQEFFCIFGFISDYMKSGTKIRQTSHNPTCNVMYHKSILVELGGFLEGLWPGEDVELDYRIKKAGYLLAFNPTAVVYHYRPNNFKDFNRMMFRYGEAQGALVRKYGFFRIIHFVPLFIFILLLTFLYNFLFGFLLFILISAPILIKLLIKSKEPLLMLRFFIASIFKWNLGFLLGLSKRQFIG